MFFFALSAKLACTVYYIFQPSTLSGITRQKGKLFRQKMKQIFLSGILVAFPLWDHQVCQMHINANTSVKYNTELIMINRFVEQNPKNQDM